MPTIRLDQEVFEGLQKLAQPFVDSPGMVIRRLLEKEGVLKKRAHAHAQPGALTPQSVYEKYLLHVLLNGKGHKRDVTHEVVKRMMKDGHIGAAEQELVSTGETRAENTITWARNALKDRGYVSRVAGRGIWELTAEGKEAAGKVMLR